MSELTKTRKNHRCQGCWGIIPKGDTVPSWSGVTDGEGYWRVWMHPECYQVVKKWGPWDWESHHPGDFSRADAIEWAAKGQEAYHDA